MIDRLAPVLLVPFAVLAVAVPIASSRPARPAPAALRAGKRLYRNDCGQCHTLVLTVGRTVEVPLEAGFGMDKRLGTIAGPGLGDLDVPYGMTIGAVYGDSAGHERVAKLVSWPQLRLIALYLAHVTKNNPRGASS